MTEIYAIPGENQQHFCLEKFSPAGSVLMSESRPTIDDICQDNGDDTGTWVVDLAAKNADTIKQNYNARLNLKAKALSKGTTDEKYQALLLLNKEQLCRI